MNQDNSNMRQSRELINQDDHLSSDGAIIKEESNSDYRTFDNTKIKEANAADDEGNIEQLIDEKEFVLLNIEVPLTQKQPLPDDSIGAYATLNMGYKQFMQSKDFLLQKQITFLARRKDFQIKSKMRSRPPQLLDAVMQKPPQTARASPKGISNASQMSFSKERLKPVEDSMRETKQSFRMTTVSELPKIQTQRKSAALRGNRQPLNSAAVRIYLSPDASTANAKRGSRGKTQR